MNTSKHSSGLDRLPRGCCSCRFPDGGIGRRRRKLLRQRPATQIDPPSPLLPRAVVILNAKTSVACLCRWKHTAPGATSALSGRRDEDPLDTPIFEVGNILSYETSLQIVQVPESTGDASLLLARSYLSSESAIYSLAPQESSGIPYKDMSNGHCQHSLIQSQILKNEDLVATLSTHTLAIPLLEVPVPLLSLALSVHVMEDSIDVDEIRNSPLRHASWKRQLVGTLLHHAPNQWTTTIQFPIAVDSSKTVSLRIESLASPRTSQASHLFVILPRTRITLQWEEPKSSVASSSDDKQIKLKKAMDETSPVAKLLLETFHCIQQSLPIPRTFLLSGPPGVGKTYAVKQALEKSPYPVTLVSLRGSELLQAHDHPAKALSDEFHAAVALAAETILQKRKVHTEKSPDSTLLPMSLIFLDECDALVSIDSMAAMLATLLDKVNDDDTWKGLVVVGATNRIDSLPSYLRRAGRFDRELPMTPPDASQRYKILKRLIQGSALENETRDTQMLSHMERIADLCVGYVPADLTALVRRARLLSLQDPSRPSLVEYLESAMNDVVASALRDASLSAPPKITWDDIAGDPGGAKTSLRQAIEWPRTKAEAFASLDLVPPRGILLHGPPGCAKTTLARAAAGASGVAFISLSPAEVYASSYVGEAEAIVRRAFALARSAAPCILFFDELDSIFGGVEDGGRGSSAEARVLSTFLNEMDGVDNNRGADGVLVLGATNRPWTLDAALLRPGRLGDKIIYIPPPDQASRKAILEMQIGNKGEHSEILDLEHIASDEVTGLMTGAELVGACQEAKMELLNRHLKESRENEASSDEQTFIMTREILMRSIQAVVPILSNPSTLEEFRLFDHSAIKG